MNLVLADFPEVVKSINVGTTFQNKNIPGYLVGLNLSPTNYEKEALARPGLLINGAHHARELTTISMNVYTLLRLLFDYTKGDQQTITLLNTSALYFIPVVNVDGFMAIGSSWDSTKQVEKVRKNRHQYPSQASCKKLDIGVDLNRNYPFNFGIDDVGSSGEDKPCSENYRGPAALSEPETQAISAFVNTWTNLKMVINLHAFGNLLIIPFNFDEAENGYLATKFPLAAKFFDYLFNNGDMPDGNRMGNGAATVNYAANGEASDYLLNTKGIYAISPELGTNS